MSSILVLLGLAAVLLLANIMLIYRNRADQARHRAEIGKTVTDAIAAITEQKRT